MNKGALILACLCFALATAQPLHAQFIVGSELDNLTQDSDNDGLFDNWEINTGTNPNSDDSDNDGFSDDFETTYQLFGWDATVPSSDSDGDGLTDDLEAAIGSCSVASPSCPTPADTDADRLSDLDEYMNTRYGYDPLVVSVDSDFDGLTDELESLTGTDPLNPDSDDDGATDFAELRAGTEPLNAGDNQPELLGMVMSGDMIQALLDLQALPANARIGAFPNPLTAELAIQALISPLITSNTVDPSAALIQQSFNNPSESPSLYKKLNDVVKELQSIAKDNANLVRLSKIGTTEGDAVKRDIYALKISDNPGTNEKGEVEILYMALHHAREVVTVPIITKLMQELLAKYKAGDKEIRKKVDGAELWFIPVVNPDGYVKVLGDKKWDWRKNTMKYGAQTPSTLGVDLNRNYAVLHPSLLTSDANIKAELKKLFTNKTDVQIDALVTLVKNNMEGSKGSNGIMRINKDGAGNFTGIDFDVHLSTYPGPSAFSEKETQAVKALVEDKTKVDGFRCSLSWHSYGGDILYPWGFSALNSEINNYRKPGDKQRFEALAAKLKAATGYDITHPFRYAVFGDSEDWLYGEKGVYAFTIEAYGKKRFFGGGRWA